MAAVATAQASPYTPLNVAFYSAVLTSLLVCLFINQAIKNPPGIYYTIMFLLGLAFVWASDGGLSATGLTGSSLVASLGTLGMITVAFGYFTAISAFDPRQNMQNWRRLFHLLMIASLLLVPVMWFAWSRWVTVVAVALFVASLFSHAVSTRTWKHHDDRQQSMPVVASVLGFVLITGIIGSLVTGYGRSVLLSWDALKLVFAIVMVPTMAAVILALADVRSARDGALEEAVEAARRDARTSASLLEMEKQYARAREAAFARSRQLTSASHDIGQPLASMRAELDTLRDEAPAPALGRLDRVLDHLEELTKSLSASARAPVEAGLHGEVEIEHIQINLLFDTLDRLFRAEAESAGMALQIEPSDLTIAAPPLILIRMLSNILSNAIRHSSATALNVRCLETEGICRIEIADNGRGFDNDHVEWAMEDGAKGGSSGGTGQGLSIVNQLSVAYALPLSSITKTGQGSTFWIDVPSVKPE